MTETPDPYRDALHLIDELVTQIESGRWAYSGLRVPDWLLQRVAREYLAAIDRGDPPDKSIAAMAQVDTRTVARWVAKARARGYLGPARQGVAG